MKELKCRDLGLKCDFVAKGDNSANVKKQMMGHGVKIHGEIMKNMTEKQTGDMDKKMDKLLA